MTNQADAATRASRIEPKPDSRLEQLLAIYDEVKALTEEYEGRLRSLKDAIKAEMVKAAPGRTVVTVHSDYLAAPLRLSQRTQWRLRSQALKAADPHTWVRYAYQQTSWYLEAAQQDGR